MKFFLAYSDPEEGMVKDHKRIAIHYLRKIFWVDLLTTVPIESIVSGALGYHYATDDPKALYLGLIRWLKLVRAHMQRMQTAHLTGPMHGRQLKPCLLSWPSGAPSAGPAVSLVRPV